MTTDFVNAVLQIKGGTGAAVAPFLKKLGLLNSDGTPTSLYDRLRNDGTSGAAVAEAVRTGYRPLYQANEYAHKLSDADLKGLILQVTGLEKGNRAAEYIYGTFKKLVAHAKFDTATPIVPVRQPEPVQNPPLAGSAPAAAPAGSGIGLSYTINLNLPASTNPEIFNAIFRSLREHIIRG